MSTDPRDQEEPRTENLRLTESAPKDVITGSEIAIIGMACRFPGAETVDQFWHNLSGGIESLSLLTDAELDEAGVDPQLRQSKNFVRRSPVIDDIELFDADFFGYTELEAKVMDPQHRLFLECAWEALERGAYDPSTYGGSVGVFTGAKTNTYLLNLFADQEFFNKLDGFQLALGNDLACMATRVSFKFDLKGPSYALHTACSTSLVAVHLACQSLLIDECQMALAGGSSVNIPQRSGYLYQPGGILSPDGSCRTFDARAQGSNFGNGAGCVLLKRLEDALEDGDHIHAVIRGSATNNDGAAKASFTAPGVEGQSSVILEAMACAEVDADSVSYVEAHGTATDLGDSIEMLALSEAFQAATQRKGFCAIGSVKTNLGHLETAAGVAGLMKTALALEHRQIPPSLHFEEPNPKIDFESSPFRVNTCLQEWPEGKTRRRAGLSSFGIGSTNAHAILEEAPPVTAGSPSRETQLLLLSARTESALDKMTERLAKALQENPEHGLADVAYSLQVGRRRFEHRRAVVCREGQASKALRSLLASQDTGPDFHHVRNHSGVDEAQDRPIAFLLPGLGDQQVNLARGLYETEATFRENLDRCFVLLERELGESICSLLYPEAEANTAGVGSSGGLEEPRKASFKSLLRKRAMSSPLDSTARAQPVLFAVEVCLALQWMEWGVRPSALLGYSLGEYAAACLAGVFSLEDAITLVARRGKLIGALPPGAMLAISLGEKALLERLPDRLVLAAVNGPGLTVAAGAKDAVSEFRELLEKEGVACQALATTHAFHSPLLEPAAAPLTELVASFELSPPKIPYLSNVTGTWVTPEQAIDSSYWARHMVEPVRFDEGLAQLLEDPRRILLEMGTGQSLATFAKVHPKSSEELAGRIFASLPGNFSQLPDCDHFHLILGKLWAAGAKVDWQGYYRHQRRRRVPLPTYPFEKRRYWVDGIAAMKGATPTVSNKPLRGPKKEDLGEWFYEATWPLEPLDEREQTLEGPWLIFDDRSMDGGGVGNGSLVPQDGLVGRVIEDLRSIDREVVRVVRGDSFQRHGEGVYELRPGAPEDYASLFTDLRARGLQPAAVIHNWGVGTRSANPDEVLECTFYSVLFLTQALGRAGSSAVLGVVTTGVQQILGTEEVMPEKATVLGPIKVAPQEVAGLTCRSIDLVPDDLGNPELPRMLITELSNPSTHRAVAYRGGQRHVEAFLPRAPLQGEASAIRLRQGGTYWITGGLGGVGRVLAGSLARDWQAKLVLTRRSPLPPRDEWQALLDRVEEEGSLSKDPTPGDSTARETASVVKDILAMEAAGGEVLVGIADVADSEAMARVLSQARERFGTLHGVLHAAGVSGGGLIQLKTREEAAGVLAPKVQGTRSLQELLIGEELDFLVLFSSLQSVLGDFGQADYCAANAFLDAVALEAKGKSPVPIVSLGWDNWRDVGIAVNTEMPAHLKDWQEDLLSRAITSEEGVEVFERSLAVGIPRLVITTQTLENRIEESRYYTSQRILEEFGGGSGEARNLGASADLEALERPELERRIAGVWCDVLGRERVKTDDNFFDLGGNSLLGMQLINQLNQELGTEVPPVVLFEAPTVGALAGQLAPEQPKATSSEAAASSEAGRAVRTRGHEDDSIAIVGMAGRFPGAQSLDEFWKNLREGVESTKYFTDEELLAAGVTREEIDSRTYVKARPVLDDVDLFDADLFALSPREAEVMDPQHRLFLECAWEALETAACDPLRFPGRIGVYAGCAISTYLLNLHSNPELMESVGTFQTMIGNEKDSLPTRVSYKLNLTGPSVAVQTFCSTSLVAVHMAAQSLLNGEADMTLAGGASIHLPQTSGYHYQEGGFVSSDGRVKAFDASADGFTFGNGVAVVALKRLADAERDGDPIRAVIRASAVNNDGSLKVGYTATSVEGQSQVIADAMAASGLSPEQIGYIETHGTGTRLGDPVEIAALTKAFRKGTEERGFCPIGSVKTNIGHLDRAAGATGLIKAVLALENGEIPPTLHLDSPNPEIDFASSPFFVNTRLRPWQREEEPRRAGVNSLGLGGTNAHVVVEEAPERFDSGPTRPWQLLLLSAQSSASLEAAQGRLASFLDERPDAAIADVAFTLQMGRRQLRYRKALVVEDGKDAQLALGAESGKRCLTALTERMDQRPVFLFPGLGGQYPGMGHGLYEAEPVFREAVDRAVELLEPELGVDLLEILFPQQTQQAEKQKTAASLDFRAMLRRGRSVENQELSQDETPEEKHLRETRFSQPALFVTQYALAKFWMSLGIEPRAFVGYSIGEYVAACLAGVLRLEDAIRLVARRALLIETLPAGGMLAVSMGEDAAKALVAEAPFSEELSLAAVNGPEQSVIAGSLEAIGSIEQQLVGEGIAARRLQVSHAFHSKLLQPVFEDLVELVSGFELGQPDRPLLSNITGGWVTEAEATDPTYWARHMVGTVRFADAVEELCREGDPVLLEVGPQALSSLVLQHPASGSETVVIPSLRHAYETQADQAFLLTALGRLWLSGVSVPWERLWSQEDRQRLTMPTYAFDRQRFWVERNADNDGAGPRRRGSRSVGIQLSIPVWHRTGAPSAEPDQRAGDWWLLGQGDAVEEACRESLEARGKSVTTIRLGASTDLGSQTLVLDGRSERGFQDLFQGLGSLPDGILFLWGLPQDGAVSPGDPVPPNGLAPKGTADTGTFTPEESFKALSYLGRALAQRLDKEKELPSVAVQLWVAAASAHEVTGGEELDTEQLLLFAAAAAVARTSVGVEVSCLDLELPKTNGDSVLRLGQGVVRECLQSEPPSLVALRGKHRWLPAVDAVDLSASMPRGASHGDVSPSYLLLNGLGDLGSGWAQVLSKTPGAHLTLIEGVGFPVREEWKTWLENDPARGLISRKILRIQELEDNGSSVEVIAADLTDEGSLRTAMEGVAAAHGRLQGTVCVFEPEGAEPLAALPLKLESLRILEGLFEEFSSDFGLLISSAGGRGLAPSAADCAAGLWLDAVAQRLTDGGKTSWCSLAWELGFDSDGLGAEETVLVERVLEASLPPLLTVSRGAPKDQWSRVGAFSETPMEESSGTVAYYARPALQVEFVPPRNSIEETIAGIWGDLLGVEQIGVYDNFLDLGGDSLLATRLISRMRDAFHLDFPIRLFFEASTVDELAAAVEAKQVAAEEEDLDELLALVDGLSEEEIEAELAQRGALSETAEVGS